jgi:subtilisin family serine protease
MFDLFRRVGLLLLATIVLAGTGAPARAKKGLKKKKSRIRKEVIVQLEEWVLFATKAMEDVHLTTRKGKNGDLLRIKLPKRYSRSAALKELSRLIRIRRLEKNHETRLTEGQQSTVPAIGDDFTKKKFLEQPALASISLPGDFAGATGKGVTVAVLDSGIADDHEIFDGRITPGHDFVDDDPDPSHEGCGHGTFTAGLVVGAAPDVTILPLRVLNEEGRGEAFMLADAIYHAAAEEADVICLSLGLAKHSPIVRAAVEYAAGKGSVVVCAAGNDGSGSILFPAMLSPVIAVTSVDDKGDQPEWAPDDRRIDASAPGVSLIGPWPGGNGKAYAVGSGTSFSAALVAGTVARLLSEDPDLSLEEIMETLTEVFE